jgi:hypothetical protein
MSSMKSIAVLAISLTACNSTIRYTGRPTDKTLREIDDSMRGASATLELAEDGVPRRVNDLAFDVDGAGWTDANGTRLHRGWSEVRRISTKSYLLGSLRGLGVGVAIGAGSGAAMYAAQGCSRGLCAVAGLAPYILGIVGGALGAAIGLGVPYRNTVESVPPK